MLDPRLGRVQRGRTTVWQDRLGWARGCGKCVGVGVGVGGANKKEIDSRMPAIGIVKHSTLWHKGLPRVRPLI
jgi:hypothetical protein